MQIKQRCQKTRKKTKKNTAKKKKKTSKPQIHVYAVAFFNGHCHQVTCERKSAKKMRNKKKKKKKRKTGKKKQLHETLYPICFF